MALGRSARSNEVDGLIPIKPESDSGADTDPDDAEPTPKQRRVQSKKRSSDVYDTSFTMDQGKPRKSINVNDDAAEKRKRRQSARVVPLEGEGEAGPSNEGATEERDSSRTNAPTKQKSQLLTVDQAPAITVPLDVLNANYEEWMKMATDGKINTANAWNFALIDYFHDMSLLRNNTDNSINFQRASCTLDGCVKIWTSRVDSVGTETGKLLNNLTNESRVGDEDEEGEDEGGEGEGAAQKRKKTHRPGSTLAKDPSQLRNKKLDLEFRVDPLFRKTCADFDEGGANGLLMNHLSLGVADGSLRVVFDASDSVPKDNEEEPSLDEPPDEVDLSYLRKTFLPDLSILDSQTITASLHEFSFSKGAFAFDNTTFSFTEDPVVAGDEDDDHEPDGFGYPDVDADGDAYMQTGPNGVDDAEPPTEDFFVGDQAVGDDYVPDYASPNSQEEGDGQGDGEHGGGTSGPYVPFDPRQGPTSNFAMAETAPDGVLFDYFDQTVKRNWMGPEHWKLRKLVRKPVETEAAPKPRREKKEAFKIDFMAPIDKDVKEIAKELFAPPSKPNAILLTGTSSGASKGTKRKRGKGKGGEEKERRDNQTLPDDMHFSSRQLVTLFLKPKFSLQMRGKRGKGELDDRHEVDEAYWAQAAADQAAHRDDEDADNTTGAIPFSTQFFQDDFDDATGFDDVDDGGEVGPDANEEEQDLLAATTGQTRRVRPQFVNYAKRAKRVDVRKLKDNIWKNLDIVVPETKEEEDAMETDEQPPATDPTEPRTFQKVITGLKQSYPKEKMEEISTSFCFICLLHLANEKGLKLESDISGLALDEDVSDDRAVGNIWDVKIYRDPNAIPAA